MNRSLVPKRTLLALSMAVAVAALLHAQATDTYKPVVGRAKRGARAMGVEYNREMVQLSKAAALSKASVITMFLLPTINMKLRPTLLALKPGTRVVSNTFDMGDWEPDERKVIGPDGCTAWCTALLWIIPARVNGTWKMAQGNLSITQSFQKISGTLGTIPITGKVTGEQIAFTAASTSYTGRVNGNPIQGSTWTASRVN
jgi:hypothetical protein